MQAKTTLADLRARIERIRSRFDIETDENFDALVLEKHASLYRELDQERMRVGELSQVRLFRLFILLLSHSATQIAPHDLKWENVRHLLLFILFW